MQYIEYVVEKLPAMMNYLSCMIMYVCEQLKLSFHVMVLLAEAMKTVFDCSLFTRWKGKLHRFRTDPNAKKNNFSCSLIEFAVIYVEA